jgi:hypothetical protein
MTITGFSKLKMQRFVQYLSAVSSTRLSVAMILLAACLSASPLMSQTGEVQTQANGKPDTGTETRAEVGVPHMIKFSGILLDGRGYPITLATEVTFALYAQPSSDTNAALWKETQHVTPNEKGGYTIYLGSASANGLPTDLFSSATAQWLGAKVEGEQELPRVLLVSVPYALKAGDASMLGGLPVSAFALAGTAATESETAVKPSVVPAGTTVTTTDGTTGYIPQFSGTASIVDSPIFAAGANVGIGNVAPTATLDVTGTTLLAGTTTVKGVLDLPAQIVATATEASSSEPLLMQTSVFNSSNSAPVTQGFEWQALPVNNNTATPGSDLALLFASGITRPTLTGLSVNSNGVLTFAKGQIFPGAGTITGVTAGTGLVGGGSVGNVTLSVDTTKIPSLTGNNTFGGEVIVAGPEIVGGVLGALSLSLPRTTAQGGQVVIGAVPFLHAYGTATIFAGGAGNFTNTTAYTVGVGHNALKALTSGYSDTALAYGALQNSTTGAQNTAVGLYSLLGNTTGSSNTAVGAFSGVTSSNGALSNTTAVGAYASVGQNNTLVLGNTTTTPGAEFVNVGIGTATPRTAMEIAVSAPGTIGPALTLTNSGSASSKQISSSVLDFNTRPISSQFTYNPSARIQAMDDGQESNTLVFLANKRGYANHGMVPSLYLESNGRVTMGGGTPNEAFSDVLDVTAPVGFYGIRGQGGAWDGNAGVRQAWDGVVGIGADGDSNNYVRGGAGGTFYGGANSTSALTANGGQGGDALSAIQDEDGLTDGVAGAFVGDISVAGSILGGSVSAEIDHPLDPVNKYLIHSSIGSSEMVNIYSGNVVTDDLGIATVKLPEWFETVNGDFRYQLTVVGRFAQAMVSKEIENHQFIISTNATNVKVSWQVTGVRKDAYAQAHPLVVEREKSPRERGFYKYPALYGQSSEKQTEWGRHPEMMQQMREQRLEMKARQQSASANRNSTESSSPPASAVGRTFATPALLQTHTTMPDKQTSLNQTGRN